MRLLLAALITLSVVACSKAPIETARAAVAASAALYGGAHESFLVYAKLPRCSVAKPPCSDPKQVVDVGEALLITRATIDRARRVVNILPGQGDTTPVTTLPLSQKVLLDDAAAAAAEADAKVKSLKTGV